MNGRRFRRMGRALAGLAGLMCAWASAGCRGVHSNAEFLVARMRVFSDEGKTWLTATLDEILHEPGDHLVSVDISPEDTQVRVVDRVCQGTIIRCRRRIWYPFALEQDDYYAVPTEVFGRRYQQLYDMCAGGAICRDTIHLTASSNPYVYYTLTTGHKRGLVVNECGSAETACRAAVVAWDWRDEGPPYAMNTSWDALVRHDALSFASLATSMLHAFDEMCRVYASGEKGIAQNYK